MYEYLPKFNLMLISFIDVICNHLINGWIPNSGDTRKMWTKICRWLNSFNSKQFYLMIGKTFGEKKLESIDYWNNLWVNF